MKPRLRNWLALWLQARRRKRGARAVADFPSVLLSNGSYELNILGRFDLSFDVAVELYDWPEGSLQIFRKLSEGDYLLIETVPTSVADYTNAGATDEPQTVLYKARYVNGTDIGPFSAELEIEIN